MEPEESHAQAPGSGDGEATVLQRAAADGSVPEPEAQEDGAVQGSAGGAAPDGEQVLPPRCVFAVEALVDEALVTAPGSEARPDRFALAHDGSEVALAFQPADCAQGLRVGLVGLDGPPVDQPSLGPLACDAPASVALARAGADWRVGWTLPADAALWHGTAGESTGELLEGTGEVVEVAMAGRDAHGVVAWTDRLADGRGLHLRSLAPNKHADLDGPIPGVQHPRGIRLADMNGAGLMAAWVDEQADQAGIFVLPVDHDGAPGDTPTRLSDRVGPRSSVDVVAAGSRALAVYTTDADGYQDVRMQVLDSAGEPTSGEMSLVQRPAQGLDASVAQRTAGSFAVFYRSPPDAEAPHWTVRLVFVSITGEVGLRLVVAEAEPNGGQTSVRALPSGALVLGWIDETAFDATLRVVRLGPQC